MLEFLNEELYDLREDELLYYVMNLAIVSEHLDADKSAFLLEGAKSGKGMVFLLTVRNKRKRYKIKKQGIVSIYSFDTLNDFINCILALYKSDIKNSQNSTYIMNNRYYICFWGRPVNKKTKVLLWEYGREEPSPSLFMGTLKEHGHMLTNKNSIGLIGESFSCTDS